ncbi:MAG: hypothetical protein ACD_62C00127G0016 [uncultured bacterium]|nr:MAG: hypothetical protein ACD_62C00127G0016 [uncultured bacterium]HLD45498.1 menaquinone biosynthesis protein [bacterium]
MKIGTVPYINGLPLTYGLTEPLVKRTPAELVNDLLCDEIDIAMVPVYAILKHNLYMHPSAGVIACDGPVKSVGFFTRSFIQELAQIRSVYLDRESLTSVFLAKILLKKYFDVSLYDVEFFHHDNRELADAQLLIGDKALFYDGRPAQFWDFGQLWKELTGLGFMFACWASKRPLSSDEMTTLVKAKELGLVSRDKIASEFPIEQQTLVRDYLTNNIIYEPSPDIKEGLKLYRSLLREYQYIESERKVA